MGYIKRKEVVVNSLLSFYYSIYYSTLLFEVYSYATTKLEE
jgi:hypothetical protein